MRRQFMRDRQEIEVDARQSLTEFIVNFPGDPRPLLLADALKFAGQRVQLAQRAFMLGAGVPACVDDRRQEGGRQPRDRRASDREGAQRRDGDRVRPIGRHPSVEARMEAIAL